MSINWLQQRIQEEQERREREAQILERLPRALEETYQYLAECIEAYIAAFGPEAAEINLHASSVHIAVREEQDGKWRQRAKADVYIDPALPGLRVERGGEALMVEVGMLPGDKLFYRDQEKFLTVEELTRRVLDRVLFPKLGE